MPKNYVWTPAKVTKFWENVSDSPLADLGFGRQAGRLLFDLVKSYLPATGAIADYGAGPGDFSRILLEKGYKVGIYEPSGKIPLELLNDDRVRIIDIDNVTPAFDALFCLETIEHVLDSEFDGFLNRMNALLRPRGILVVSTPNNEDLDRSKVYCVDIDAFFHPWQHVRSFTQNKLVELLAARGFKKTAIGLADFSYDASVRTEIRSLKLQIADFLAILRNAIEEKGSKLNELKSHLEHLIDQYWSAVLDQLSQIVQPITNHINDLIRRHEEITESEAKLSADSRVKRNHGWISVELQRLAQRVVRTPGFMLVSSISVRIISGIVRETVELPPDKQPLEAVRLVSFLLDEAIRWSFEQQSAKARHLLASSENDRLAITFRLLGDVGKNVLDAADEAINALRTRDANANEIATKVQPIVNHINELIRQYTVLIADGNLGAAQKIESEDSGQDEKFLSRAPERIAEIASELSTLNNSELVVFIQFMGRVLTELAHIGASKADRVPVFMTQILNELTQLTGDQHLQKSHMEAWEVVQGKNVVAMESLARTSAEISAEANVLLNLLRSKKVAIQLLRDSQGRRSEGDIAKTSDDIKKVPFSKLQDHQIVGLITDAYKELLQRRGDLYDVSQMESQGLDFFIGSGQTIVYIGEKVREATGDTAGSLV